MGFLLSISLSIYNLYIYYLGTPIHLAFGVFVCWCIPRCRPELVGPPGMSPTSQAKGRHYRQDRHRRLPPLFSFVGSTGTGSEISGLGKMMKWIYGFSDKPWSLDLFLGSREIWSVWFGCFGLFNASNCPNCNVLRVRFFFGKKSSHSQTWTKQGNFWIISAISHRHDKETSPWKWTSVYLLYIAVFRHSQMLYCCLIILIPVICL